MFGWDDDLVAGFWVSPYAGRAVRQRKAAETANLYAGTLCESVPDSVKHQANRQFSVTGHQMGKTLRESCHQA
jgi:hypothetical protein